MSSNTVKYQDLIYLIDQTNKTAGIAGFYSNLSDYLVPRSITVNSVEYLVTSILEDAFKNSPELRTIQFPPDSEIKFFFKDAFNNSSIEFISLPPHLTKICEGCFSFCSKLQKIEIPPNSELQIIDDKAFYSSSIESFTIPPHLTIIGKTAFAFCEKLHEVKIQSNSQLQVIDNVAFYGTLIERFTIPPHLTRIGDSAFSNCLKLERIEMPKESSLQIIENNAFFISQIQEITIPSSVVYLNEFWCSGITNLKRIKIMPNNKRYSSYKDKFILEKSSLNKETYDILVFSIRDVETVTIPDSVEIIKQFCFSDCKNLQKVEMSNNSKLRIIESNAFSGSSIECLTIPPLVDVLADGWCNGLS